MAALVRELTADRVVLDLVNLSPTQSRVVVIQAGAFAEHEITQVRYDGLVDSEVYPGPQGAYNPPTLSTMTRALPVDDRWLQVQMPPGNRISLELGMKRFVHQPTYASLWRE